MPRDLGELSFAPEDRTGTWMVPDRVPHGLWVTLEDDRDPPARALYDIFLAAETGDTGLR